MEKMKSILILGIIIFTYQNLYGQTEIEYYNRYGARTGSARIKEYKSPYIVHKPSEYRSGVPIEMIYQTLAQKQAKYDYRVQVVQNKIYEIGYDITDIYKEEYPEEYNYYVKKLQEFTKYMTDANIDLSIDREYNNVLRNIELLHKNVINNE